MMPRGIIKLFISLILISGLFFLVSCSSMGNSQDAFNHKLKHREHGALQDYKADNRAADRASRKDKTQRDYDKKQAQLDKEAKKAYKEDLKKHEKIQSKSTRKMMRQSMKRAKKLNRSKKT